MSTNKTFVAVNADFFATSTVGPFEAIKEAISLWEFRPKGMCYHDRPREQDHWVFEYDGTPDDLLGISRASHTGNGYPRLEFKGKVRARDVRLEDYRATI